jgi:CDP-glucose 4,6-dehydratase
MEGLVNPDESHWTGRSVFVTGHTGFKGGWIVAWLHHLRARIHGYALDPPTSPSLFDAAAIGSMLASDNRGDIADLATLRQAMRTARPEVVIHLAAKSLVRDGYGDPISTLTTNVIGTATTLEAARSVDSIRSVVVVTSDKVYEHVGPDHPYVEGDPLGGRDPYSASKAAAELVAGSYRSSFFADDNHPARIATVRAGNVIGGGDWAKDRLVPDCLRAFDRGDAVRLRFPQAIRPWQHVLEPLSGYLNLAQRLTEPDGDHLTGAWNFGPNIEDQSPVIDVARQAAAAWGDSARVQIDHSNNHPRESGILMLDTTKARQELGWRPKWTLRRAIESTVEWHRAWRRGASMLDVTSDQIRAYEAAP